jgi:thiol:disulfide interchange protein
MKRFALLLGVLCSTIGLAQEKIQWMSIEEAYELTLTEENPKKIFIDVYTDWCGWCKRMDKATFQNEEVGCLYERALLQREIRCGAEGRP